MYGARLCRVKRNTCDKIFPGQSGRWWLRHWPRFGPITLSGALEYEGFLQLSGHWRAFNHIGTKRTWNMKEVCLWKPIEAKKTLCKLGRVEAPSRRIVP